MTNFVTGYTADRMKDIEDSAIIDGEISGDDLILKRRDGGVILAGSLRGPQGIKGDIGPEGPRGEAGTGVNIKGSYGSYGALIAAHPSGALGDAYLVAGDLYVWAGSAWSNVGTIQGPQGVQGIQGPAGIVDPQPINNQSGTNYTLVLADAKKLIILSNAAATTLTIPTNSAVPIPIGTYIDVLQGATGQVTVVAAGSPLPVLLVSGLTTKARARYSRIGLQKVAQNSWSIFGDLAAV